MRGGGGWGVRFREYAPDPVQGRDECLQTGDLLRRLTCDSTVGERLGQRPLNNVFSTTVKRNHDPSREWCSA